MAKPASTAADSGPTLSRELGLWDGTMLVAGSMIGSGIFIVAADIAGFVDSAGWVLVTWVITGLLTVFAALSFGQLAQRIPHTGGQYAYLRELYGPIFGFLYGWTYFMVINTGSAAAVAVGFARYLGVMVPWINAGKDAATGADTWVVAPIRLSDSYAISLSTQQLVAILSIVLLTWLNSRGLKLGKLIQSTFTSAKTLALVLLIVVGLTIGWNADAVASNFRDVWTPRHPMALTPGLSWLPELTASMGFIGLLVALCVAQVGSLFSADAWNSVTFTAGEVKDPRRTVRLALIWGTVLVTALYVLANLAYLVVLPMDGIRNAADSRVATAVLEQIWGPAGATVMAVAIVISTFGCNNGLLLSGARVYYAMARDGVFFKSVGTLNKSRVPGVALWWQCVWACALVLPRTVGMGADGAPSYGNLYSDLLDYVIFATLIFYVLTCAGLFKVRLREGGKPAEGAEPVKLLLPTLYCVGATLILLVLLAYKTNTTWPGLIIVLAGVPVFYLWGGRAGPAAQPEG
ncbi:MAG TPA: amino acid permease [Planctomycetota bacterium]|nr:amino acid permease [Planctomycetota bacterium]